MYITHQKNSDIKVLLVLNRLSPDLLSLARKAAYLPHSTIPTQPAAPFFVIAHHVLLLLQLLFVCPPFLPFPSQHIKPNNSRSIAAAE